MFALVFTEFAVRALRSGSETQSGSGCVLSDFDPVYTVLDEFRTGLKFVRFSLPFTREPQKRMNLRPPNRMNSCVNRRKRTNFRPVPNSSGYRVHGVFPAFSNSQKVILGVRVREGFGVGIGLSYKNSTLTIVDHYIYSAVY